MLRALDSINKYYSLNLVNFYSTSVKIKHINAYPRFKRRARKSSKNDEIPTNQLNQQPKQNLNQINLTKIREGVEKTLRNAELLKTSNLLVSHASKSAVMYPVFSKFNKLLAPAHDLKKQHPKQHPHQQTTLTSSNIKELANSIRDEKDLQNTEQPVLQTIKRLKSFISKQQEQRPTVAKSSQKTQEFNQEIFAYVSVCLNSKVPGERKEAYEIVDILSNQEPVEEATNSKRAWRYLNDIEIYNLILYDCTKSGDYARVVKYTEKYRKLGIKPNIHSFAACLLALGNSSNEQKSLAAVRILDDIKKFGLNVNEIFNTTDKYTKEEFDVILEMIKLKEPSFELPAACVDYRLNSNYKMANDLLKKLYDKSGPLPTRKLNDFDQSEESLTRNVTLQFGNEKSNVVKVPSIYKFEIKNQKIYAHQLEKIISNFRIQLSDGFHRRVKLLETSNDSDELLLKPFLTVLEKADDYVDIMMQEIERLCQGSLHFTQSYNYLCKKLGEQLEKRYIQTIQKENCEKLKEVFNRYVNEIKTSECNLTDENHRQKFMRLLNEDDLNLKSFAKKWSLSVHTKIGAQLYTIILENVKVHQRELYQSKNKKRSQSDKIIHPIQRIYRNEGMYKHQEISVLPALARLYTHHSKSLSFSADLLPMVTPPLPWISPDIGGFMLTSSNLLRLDEKNPEQYEYIQKQDKSQMYPIYDSLNALASCPWKINTRILDLMISIFNNNGDEKLNIPKDNAKMSPLEKLNPEMRLSKAEYKAFVKKHSQEVKARNENFSLWCTELYRLSIANMYRDQVIYFPHSLDFRGRTYPIPPHFSHLGSDVARSLIQFAMGRPLGKNGLKMLKIHCINLTGTKKRHTIEERHAYANEILAEIIDSGQNPSTGRGWWKKSEEPWQTLACCMEIANAINSDNPEAYVSHYPIHQDGSCNGLQHYAALGRDPRGAVSVNLHPSDRPQDVYSDIADRVEEKRKKEALAGLEIAKILKGHINRKVIKQTVMTTVYNVTSYGARQQIQRQLEDLEKFPQQHKKEASKYLAEKTFESLNEVFHTASQIQDWFCDCSYLIAKVRMSSTRWVTPLGLPVIQPYYAKPKDGYVRLNEPVFSEKMANTKKNRNAFPPNFIHSLDSTHMMLTSLYCQKENIRFVSVHDCFWTHASDTDEMNRICREQFIKLHSLTLLENLSEYFLKNFKFSEQEMRKEMWNAKVISGMREFNQFLKAVPKKGEFELERVKDSVYFFS